MHDPSAINTSRVLYFAYGSNLDPTQMKERCPTVEPVDAAILHGYRLIFAGASKNWDGGGVATILPAPELSVPGYLYSLNCADLARLDRFEGSYDRKPMQVLIKSKPYIAWVYVRRSSEPRSKPNPKYLSIMRSAYKRLSYSVEILRAAGLPELREL